MANNVGLRKRSHRKRRGCVGVDKFLSTFEMGRKPKQVYARAVKTLKVGSLNGVNCQVSNEQKM